MIGGSGWALHPFLFAILPILYLYARNLAEVAARVIVAPVVLSLLGCGVLLWASVSFLSASRPAARS